MKANSRLRRLNFIQNKNLLLSGKRHGYAANKVTLEFSNDPKLLVHAIDETAKQGWCSLKRKWKLKRDYKSFEHSIGQQGDDFMRNLKTIQIKFIL